MTEQNRAATLDDVRREIADALQSRDRATAAERARHRVEAGRFDEALFVHFGAGLVAFAGCWTACALLVAALAADPRGAGAFVFMTVGPFLLWIAGAVLYARKAFGPKSEGDDGGAW